MSIETWSKHYWYDENVNFYNKSAQLNSTSGLYYVYNVLFSGVNGQCIYFSNSYETRLLVDFVTFSELRGNVDGLGIYMNEGECVQLHVCDINPDNKMESDYAHSFTSIPTPNSVRTLLSNSDTTPVPYRNFLFDSSISSAISDQGTILQYGYDNRIENVNNSYAKCNYDTFAEIKGIFYLKFCSIINNSADSSAILFFQGLNFYNYYSSLNQCNFIKNEDKHVKEDNGIIFFSQYGENTNPIESLAFIGNKCQYLFYVKSGTPNIQNCYFENNGLASLINDDSINVGTTDKLSNNFSHYSTYLCEVGVINNELKHSMDISKSYNYVYIMNTLLSMPIFIFINRE